MRSSTDSFHGAEHPQMRPSNSIFRKLLFSAFLLIAVSLLIMDFYLTRYMADLQRDAVQQQLTAEARIWPARFPRTTSPTGQ